MTNVIPPKLALARDVTTQADATFAAAVKNLRALAAAGGDLVAARETVAAAKSARQAALDVEYKIAGECGFCP